MVIASENLSTYICPLLKVSYYHRRFQLLVKHVGVNFFEQNIRNTTRWVQITILMTIVAIQLFQGIAYYGHYCISLALAKPTFPAVFTPNSDLHVNFFS
jgi:hypothetical protein